MAVSRTTGFGLAAAAVVAVLFIALIVALSGGGSGPAGAAQAFFAANAQKGTQAAWSSASPAFQQSVGADQWASISAQHNLSQYSSSSWTRQGSGDVATLSGVLTLKGGGTQPADARMVKGANGWSLFSLNLPSGGVEGAQPAMPAAQGQQGQPPAGQPVQGAGVADNAGYAPPNSSLPPNGLPPNGLPPNGPPPPNGAAPSAPPATPNPYPDYGAAGGGATPPGTMASSQPGGPLMLTSSRVARLCGGHVLKLQGVSTVKVHCHDGLSTVPGSSVRCLIAVNGREQTVVATLRSYDAARNDAELDCQPGPPE